MPKRKRLHTPMKKKASNSVTSTPTNSFKLLGLESNSSSTPRGRLQGALLEVLDPSKEDSDAENIVSVKRENNTQDSETSEDEPPPHKSSIRYTNPSKSYVLKLFDRSVDLSQFDEDSALYPICRAWMLNQPKADYRSIGQDEENQVHNSDAIVLPGPEGPSVSRIPKLLEAQAARSKDNINLNYREAPPPSRESLLQSHIHRWAVVRKAWVDQAARVEARYEGTQQVLNKMNVNAV